MQVAARAGTCLCYPRQRCLAAEVCFAALARGRGPSQRQRLLHASPVLATGWLRRKKDLFSGSIHRCHCKEQRKKRSEADLVYKRRLLWIV